jgi:hypothetical protein
MKEKVYATMKHTPAGPELYIGKLLVRSWLGCKYDDEAKLLAAMINREIADRA